MRPLAHSREQLQLEGRRLVLAKLKDVALCIVCGGLGSLRLAVAEKKRKGEGNGARVRGSSGELPDSGKRPALPLGSSPTAAAASSPDEENYHDDGIQVESPISQSRSGAAARQLPAAPPNTFTAGRRALPADLMAVVVAAAAACELRAA